MQPKSKNVNLKTSMIAAPTVGSLDFKKSVCGKLCVFDAPEPPDSVSPTSSNVNVDGVCIDCSSSSRSSPGTPLQIDVGMTESPPYMHFNPELHPNIRDFSGAVTGTE